MSDGDEAGRDKQLKIVIVGDGASGKVYVSNNIHPGTLAYIARIYHSRSAFVAHLT